MVLRAACFIAFVILTTSGSEPEQLSCPITLPQDVPSDSQCYQQRGTGLIDKRSTYGIRHGPDAPFGRIDMTVTEFKRFMFSNDFIRPHALLWKKNLDFVRAGQELYGVDKVFVNPTMNISQFDELRKFFLEYLDSPRNLIKPYLVNPSSKEPFNNNIEDYISDKLFAEQRLAGTNTMTIQKITDGIKDHGMAYETLKKLLNPRFNWINAVSGVLTDVTDENSLIGAINDGRLFVLYNQFSKDLKTQYPDITDGDPRRQMWPHMAPISVFASQEEPAVQEQSTTTNTSSTARLMPVAIQMDAKPDSPVFTPKDGDSWMLAKLNAQLTDLGDSQMVEHLTKVHFVSEAICLAVERQLSEQHPLHDLLKHHCLGIYTTNTLAAPELLGENLALHEIFGYGNEGGGTLANRAASMLQWRDLDPRNNVKRRGMDDKKRVPYYPYRDDSKVIFKALYNMAKEYVDLFYKDNKTVKQDEELQNFVREISSNDGGKIRGFPRTIKSKKFLKTTLTRIIWIPTGQHSSAGYPVADYATYIPNVSTKMYNVLGIRDDVFNGARLNSRLTAALQSSFFYKIGLFRYDRIFDYAEKLQNQQAKELVAKHRDILNGEVQKKLEERNEKRLKDGHLTYPYLLPKWLSNGVQN